MSNLTITVEVFPGSSVAHACSDLQTLANRLGLNVVATMNGVRCMAVPGGDPLLLIQRQQDAQDSRGGAKLATSRPEVRHG